MSGASHTSAIDACAPDHHDLGMTTSAKRLRLSSCDAPCTHWSLVHKRRMPGTLPHAHRVCQACVPAMVAYSRVPAAAAVLRLRGTSEMAVLAAMCMMAVERSRGGYARV